MPPIGISVDIRQTRRFLSELFLSVTAVFDVGKVQSARPDAPNLSPGKVDPQPLMPGVKFLDGMAARKPACYGPFDGSVEPHKSNRGRYPAVDRPLFNGRIRCAGTRQRPS